MKGLDGQSFQKSALRVKLVLNRTGVPLKPSAELARATVIRDKGLNTLSGELWARRCNLAKGDLK